MCVHFVSSCMVPLYLSPRMSIRCSSQTAPRTSWPVVDVVVCRHVHCAVTPQQRGGDAYYTGGLSAHSATTITESYIGGGRRATTAFPRGTHPSLGSCRLASNGHQDSRCWLSGCFRLRAARAGPGLGQTRFHGAKTNTRDDFPWSPLSRPLTWQRGTVNHYRL